MSNTFQWIAEAESTQSDFFEPDLFILNGVHTQHKMKQTKYKSFALAFGVFIFG